jgi:ribosomal protein S18 acetylase RimI-like enzyme
MHYRLFEPEDFDDLYAIEEVCFEPPHRFSRRYMRHLVQSENAATWVAVESFCLSGFAIVEWSSQNGGGDVSAYITTIEVVPESRAHGIGSELLRRVEGSAHAEGAVEIRLHVDVENASAIRLYETNGYRNVGRAEHYYARGRAAKIYTKQLAR